MDAANFLYHTPYGPIYGLIGTMGLQRLVLPDPDSPIRPYLLHSRPNHLLGRRLHALLEQYFAGVVTDFDEIPLETCGTAFQESVWRAVRAVPYGITVSYRDLAKSVSGTNAARAVGQALKQNPVPIVVPCHRVISASGGMGGFSAPMFWKKLLLDLEQGARNLKTGQDQGS